MGIASGVVDRFVESQIFFPDQVLTHTPADLGMAYEDLRIVTADKVGLHGWLVRGEPGKALILFCHGNAGNISHRLDNVFRLRELGYGVLIFDYRGYGRSEGVISEKGFYLDVEAAYQAALREANRRKVPFVIFGRSLGGIAAVHVAAAGHCSGVILESTFTNLGAMANEHFHLPAGMVGMESRFNAAGKIHAVRAPILFFHGNRDGIVPIVLGKELYRAAPEPKEFVTLEGAGHNDTYLVGGQEYFKKFKEFVDGL